MSTNIAHKRFVFSKRRLINFISFMVSIAYGLFIVYSLRLQYSLGSGDIASYIFYFEITPNNADAVVVSGDYAFRIAIFALTDLLEIPVIDILSYLAFITSSIISYLFLSSIRSEKSLIYLIPLIVMIFFTPNVQTLFSSGIRSGVAFTFLMIGFVLFKGVFRYVFFFIASIIHLSMLPMIGFYIFFNFLNHKRVGSPIVLSLFLLMATSFIMAFVASSIFFVGWVASSLAYNLMLLYLATLIIFINKKILKDQYGFLAAGLMLIYLSGLIIDASFIRYIGNAIIFYLFFLINRGNIETIRIFTVAYIPFFLLTLSYSISNVT